MRSKAPLVLMEQMVMLLVFALATALCLQAFVKSDEISKNSEARDRAAFLCQSAAEIVQSCGGEPDHALSLAAARLEGHYEQGLLRVDYDGEWNRVPDGMYRLTAQAVPGSVPGLHLARVAVEREGETLFEIQAAWQGEVVPSE